MIKTKHLVFLSLLVSLSLVIYQVELLIPVPLPIPGVKLGLANMISLATLILDGPYSALIVLLLRIILGQLLNGQLFALILSLTGGIASLGVTAFLHAHFKNSLSIWSLSLAGGMVHNLGQLLAAYCLLQTPALFYNLPVLMILGLLCGLICGLGAQFVITHLQRFNH